jgi:RHS repeat-associated protein
MTQHASGDTDKRHIELSAGGPSFVSRTIAVKVVARVAEPPKNPAGDITANGHTGSSTMKYLFGDHSLVPQDRLSSQTAQKQCRRITRQPHKTGAGKVTRQAITSNTSGNPLLPPPNPEERDLGEGKSSYYAWGEKRWSSGTLPTDPSLCSGQAFQFTGQRREKDLGPAGGEGLYIYGARWYDPSAGRFIQADTIIPGGVQGLDRYAYSYGNPVKYTDPTGHYGEEVHRDLTYQIVHDAAMNIADEMGFGLNELKAFANYLASEVVRGDMAADSMNPDGTINLDYIYNEPLSPPMYIPLGDIEEGTTWVESKAPYWYTTPEAIADIKNANNPFDFGIASHEYQDSFAHWQKLGQPDTPLGIWAAHALNNPYKLINPTLSVDYFEPGTATEDRRIDSAMMNGYTGLVDSFVRTQINNWSYDGR